MLRGTKTEICDFLGECNVYRHFVYKFPKIVWHLKGVLRKDASMKWTSHPEEQVDAFQRSMARLTTTPISALSNRDRPYMFEYDSSAYAVGAVLLQDQDEENPKELAPVRYW